MKNKEESMKNDVNVHKRLELSVYERYLMFGRQFSRQIAEKEISGFNFFEEEEEILFVAGENFPLKHKNGNAVVYSKLLAETIRKKLGIVETDTVKRLFVQNKDGYYHLSIDSVKFLQISTKK